MLVKKLNRYSNAPEMISNHFKKFFQGSKCDLIGVEFEFPILSLDEKNWSPDIITKLNTYITDVLCFQPILFADQEPIAFAHPVFKDKISYEVTHSTLEFSLHPKASISDLETAFLSYFLPIQAFLLRSHVFLGCVGLHPFDYYQTHPVLRHPHYQNIDRYLRRCSKANQDDFYRAPSMMIGSQTHVEVPFNQIYKYQNAYHSLGWLESKLMANSHYKNETREYYCYRDILLRNCGFGHNSENVSYPSQYFDCNRDFFQRFAQKSIFTKK